MAQLSPILRSVEGGFVAFQCPGCARPHMIRVEGEERPRWGFNGNAEAPTFTPSILVRGRTSVCHSFVTDGRIQFLGDCTHALAGQTVDLPPFDEG